MATNEGPQQHKSNLNDLASDTKGENNTSFKESTLLLGNERQRASVISFRCRRQRCCLKSKAAILILLWNLILVAGLKSFFDPSYFDYTVQHIDVSSITILIMSVGVYSVIAFLFLFYPLAGCLADIQWGRYKTIINSLCIIWGSLMVMVVLSGIATASITIPVSYPNQITRFIISGMVLGFPCFIAFISLLCSLVSFSANVLQYGVDQLHDAPTDDSILYIHWYVWTSYAGLLPMKLGFNVISDGFFLYSPCLILLPLLILGVTLCIQRYKCHWFLIDSGSRNPYKLVYKVLKFAKDHTHPIRRSAFTYCEDELPSRLDLGKEKYGGHFTTEQVEDVKAFLGILRVLLTLGPILMVDFSVGGILIKFTSHLRISNVFKHTPNFKTDTLILLLITLLIPLYLCLLRPYIRDYVPGMLKRIGLGMICILLSILCTTAMDAYGHIHANVTACFLNDNIWDYTYETYLTKTLNISSYFLIIQYSLNALGYMFLYIAVYEFICAQSPHAMKGFVVGTFFAIKGVFQLLGVIATYLPFAFGWSVVHSFPSCGFLYYLINAIIALVGIVAYACVAGQYQYRERDEPDNIYRYAEEYYANAQDEPNYDYDNYNDLNVHTISN